MILTKNNKLTFEKRLMPEKGVEMNSIKLTLLLFSFLYYSFLNTSTAQWVQASNGMGNRIVYQFAYSGSNIFAGTFQNGVYLSTDNGANWTQTSLNDRSVWSLAISGNNIFAGSDPPGGVYLSTNNGTTWTQTSLGNWVLSFAINGNYIFAGTNSSGGVYLSTNNGTNWTQTSLNNRSVYSLAIDGSNLFAGTTNGVYLSTDNGTTWTQTSLNNHIVRSLAISGNNIFAGVGQGPATNGVYLSTDNGTNWVRTSLNTPWVNSLALNGNNLFAGTNGNGVYVSNDNGTSWTQRNEGLGNVTVWSLGILNNYIFAGVFGGVYRRPLGELTSIQQISNLPKQFSLSQNYPNPFNPTTKIKFATPKSSFVRLVVYDAVGRELATMVNEQLNAGTYEAEWSVDKFSNGIYYYKLTSGNYSETKKMIIVK